MTKQTKCSEHPAKTQIRLGGSAQCPVWSEPSLCAQWIAKDPRYIHADGEDSDQTGRMLRLIWVFTGRIYHFIGFVMLRLILSGSQKSKQSEVSWVNVILWDAVQQSLNPFARSYGREKGNIDMRRRWGNEENLIKETQPTRSVENKRPSDTQRYRTLRHWNKSVPLHRSKTWPKQMVKCLSALAVLVYYIV